MAGSHAAPQASPLGSIRRACFQCFAFVLPVAVLGVPLCLVVAPFSLWPTRTAAFATALLGPVSYAVLYVLCAGLFSLPFQKAIVPGRFPRDLSHPIYVRRRMYGSCWAMVYYFKPIYALCLSIPILKRALFRLFGYRGPTGFTVYPDTWIRDLPLLHLGNGAYVANRATLGTNIALSNGRILVDRIQVDGNAMVGHLAMIAPGAIIGCGAQIGVGAMIAPGAIIGQGAKVGVGSAIGIRCELGEGSLVRPMSTLDHRAIIGADAVVETMSYVGRAAVIGPKISIASGALIRARARILAQTTADAVPSARTAPGEWHASSRPHGAVTAVGAPAIDNGLAEFQRGCKKRLVCLDGGVTVPR